MNLLNLLAVLIFSSSSLGGSSSENLSFANEENYKDGMKYNYFTPNPKDYSEIPPTEDAENDNQEKNEEDESGTSVDPGLPGEHILNESLPLIEIITKKNLMNLPSQVPHFDFEGDYHDEEPKPNQSLMRRQVNGWETSDELFDPNGVFRNVDASYSRTDSSHVQSEYLDENYPFDANQRNDSSLEELEGSFQVEPPQYYQKNYYYNYYPLIRGRYDQSKYKAQKLGSDEEVINPEATMQKNSETNEKFYEKKIQKKNPCKLYLKFLKYAFRELDKNSEYYDDFNEEYTDWETDGSHRVFATQLLGPTLYIDNSGRVFQVNNKGNSIQTVERILPSARDSPSERDLIGLKSTTPNSPNEHKTETPPSQHLYNSFIITYERPSAEMNLNTESYSLDGKESHSMISDEKHTNPLTDPPDIEKGTTFTEPSFFLTTTSPPKSVHEEYYGRSGIHWAKPPISKSSNESYSSVGSPLYLHRHPNLTISSIYSDKSHLRANTMLSLENSHKQDNKDVDCNDKMLPCPDTFNVTYPLNGYCNRYVSCESGVAVRRTCENGFHFNVITKSCDFPHNSICSYYCPEPNGRFGIPGDCSGYFICQNSIPEYRICPPRMHWDIRISSCNFAALSSCPMKCSSLNEIKPYKGDCKAYIICLNGIPYYHKCPPNFIYNKENQTCVPENMFNCKNDPKLMTKTSNPSTLCRNVDQKLGTKAWCSYYFPSENAKSDEKFTGV